MRCPKCGFEWDKEPEWKPDMSQVASIEEMLKEKIRKRAERSKGLRQKIHGPL